MMTSHIRTEWVMFCSHRKVRILKVWMKLQKPRLRVQ
jgi:hypothetical protein